MGEAKKLLILSFLLTFLGSIPLLGSFYLLQHFEVIDFFFTINGSAIITFLVLWVSTILNLLEKSVFLYFNRFTKIMWMSMVTFVPVITYNILAVLLGWFDASFEILVLAKLLSFTFVFICFIKILLSDIQEVKEAIRLPSLKEVAWNYRNYPKYILPSKFLNVLAVRSADFIVAGLFGNNVLGQFTLAKRVVMIPETTISKSVSDIFRRQGFDSDGNPVIRKVKQFFFNYLKIQMVLAVFMFGIAYLLVPYAVDLLLDEKWSDVVWISRVLIFGYAVSYIVNTLISVFRTLGEEKKEVIFQIFFVSVLIIVAVVAKFIEADIDLLIKMISFHRGISFVFAFFLMIWLFKKKDR
ncbi:MAG: oligosaccharide flippase family protein [Cytophagales bacterium]|nr:oligosaccharide flippase family protein [Cytophagales bacterium]